MRLRLKVAILAAGKSQRQVALETNLISENKLSDIVRGWTEPRDDEKAALARVRSLNRSISSSRNRPHSRQSLGGRRGPVKEDHA